MKMKKLKRWISCHNPLGTWYKVRHWFKMPKAVFYLGLWYGGGTGLDFHAPWWKIIQFSCTDLQWTDKTIHENDINCRFDEPPQLNIVFFKTYLFSCKFIPRGKNGIDWEHEDVYWETILNIIHYNMNLLEAIENNTWRSISKSDNFESRKKENVYTEQMLTDEGEKEMFYLIAKRVENDKEIGDIC